MAMEAITLPLDGSRGHAAEKAGPSPGKRAAIIRNALRRLEQPSGQKPRP
jgi:hypothetical protein